MTDKMEDKLATASLDYEAECDRLLRQQEKLMAEIDHLRTELKCIESECFRNAKYCRDCVYWGGEYTNNYCCNYIFCEGHRRPCPPGKDCTEKIIGKRKWKKSLAIKAQ